MQFFQGVIFRGDDGFALGEQTIGGARVIPGQLDHAARGQVFRRGCQLVDHVGIGGAEILRIAGIGNQDRLSLFTTSPKDLSRDELFQLAAAWPQRT